MTQELSIRVKALINDLFFFDRPRALIITDEVTDLLVRAKLKGQIQTAWDKMDGVKFSRLVSKALQILRWENPSLFL